MASYKPSADCLLVARTLQIPADLSNDSKSGKVKNIWVSVGKTPIVRKAPKPTPGRPVASDTTIPVATEEQLKFIYEEMGNHFLVDKIEAKAKK